MQDLLRIATVIAALVAAAASATAPSGPAKVPMTPLPNRSETVSTETAIDGLTVTAAPYGVAGWEIRITNNTDASASAVWDESTFVSSRGESGGRLIRGETKRMDLAKSQPPTPIPPHSHVSQIVFAEKLAEDESLEGDYAESNEKWGGISPGMESALERRREVRTKLIAGSALNVTLQLLDAKKTWTGRVSGGPNREAVPAAAVKRGFFCSSSPSNPTAGFCARGQSECVQAREAALAGVADLAECTGAERAYCFGKRCAPTADACAALRARVLGPDGTGPECGDSE